MRNYRAGWDDAIKEIKERLMNKFNAKDEDWIRESIKEVLGD